ncbi:MAG: helix-turn-helix domain-containing protein [Candidatus Nanopelagicales bacterium]
MTPRTERGPPHRSALLEAAREAFEERGYDDCRMNGIADAAGVSHGTVYVLRVQGGDPRAGHRRVAGQLRDDLRTSAKDPLTRIEEANRRYLRAYRDNSRLLRVIEQAAVTHPELGHRLDEFRQRYHARVSTALRRLQERERVTADLAPDVAATALCAMVRELLHTGNDPDRRHQPDPDQPVGERPGPTRGDEVA